MDELHTDFEAYRINLKLKECAHLIEQGGKEADMGIMMVVHEVSERLQMYVLKSSECLEAVGEKVKEVATALDLMNSYLEEIDARLTRLEETIYLEDE